ncbi:MAG: FmdB family zinc ribbon protein [Pseudomonadota bacterium]
MPIYEYECTACGRVEEALQKISDAPLEICRHCKGQLHKLVSQSSFHLKGSGWYVTDYGGTSSKKGSTSPAKENASAACESSPSSSTGSSSTED